MTELDFTTLAIIGRDGPLSAYDVRKVLAVSVTPMWSSSPGAVYPSIRRLKEAGLISALAEEGSRRRRALRITPPGRKILKEWLTTISPEIAAPTPDPIRTRMYFLGLLESDSRHRLVADAISATQEAIAIAERRFAERSVSGASKPQQLAAEGVLHELRARLCWLGQLSGKLSDS